MDEDLYWNQSDGSYRFTFIDSDRHGKVLVLHEHSETYSRVVGYSRTMSSVGATG
ncbi:MAG: hypothetical protein J07HQW1_01805 [Haloquadratum walsbyi J07HQW1]|uniref:Uncharacterized protein n=1 Tax=Haloquadratum walsbyi J07HQW1 TaxID=1238424 RepID=U1PHY1_9EURY|nr:MAG: hypothetical protein J07HQW1_01805 [Haloquadratum walsbyi J07HQW1]